MKKLNKLALAAAKVLEILHWIGAASGLVLLVVSLTARDWLASLLQGMLGYGSDLSVYGFELTAAGPDGTVNVAAFSLFAAGMLVILSLMAMVFRNVYLCFKTAKGGTWFSKGGTPFQKDITRMVREIGIFYVSVPVAGLLLSGAARLILGPDVSEISVDLSGLVTGVLLLCLSQVFAYGARLQDDVDGLL